VSTFGHSLVKLDIRQEHTDALDAITVHLGIGTYRSWHEEKRQEWLLSELRGKREACPLFGDDLPMYEELADVLGTLRILAELPPDCFGAYVISMETTPSDVLAVELPQRECHLEHPLRVVPLFEKLADLERPWPPSRGCSRSTGTWTGSAASRRS
jgi:phosphoenolpyruvate carboxylase